MRKYLFIACLLLLLGSPWLVSADVTQNVVTGSRSLGSVYQNTTGYPLFVAINAFNNVIDVLRVYSNPTNTLGTVVCYQGIASVSFQNNATCTIVVPQGYYYGADSANGAVLQLWTEWPMASTSPGTTTITNLLSGTSTVMNPTQDLFNGLLMFWMVFVFIIWFFKIDRHTKK